MIIKDNLYFQGVFAFKKSKKPKENNLSTHQYWRDDDREDEIIQTLTYHNYKSSWENITNIVEVKY